MKRVAILTTVVAILTFAIGFAGGWHAGSRERNALIELAATDRLAQTLFVLTSIENGKVDEAVMALQGSSNEQIDWIIEYGDLNRAPDRVKFKCALLTQLKSYRARHSLFEGSKWDYLWKVPGMRELEERRKAFLEKAC
jgi:hypothetical protein